MSEVLWVISAGIDEPMIKKIYRTYDSKSNMLHWRESGAAMMGMLCGRGNFIDWDIGRWERKNDADSCQECDVQYVLAMMS
jgi:hypothetical protein